MHSKYYNQNTRFKTQKALESINHYEQINEHFRSKISKFKEQLFTKQNYRIINESQWNRIQLESGASELYELMNGKNKGTGNESNMQLKIIIKHFTGTAVHLSLSAKPQIIALKKCEHKITGQKILKYKNPAFLGNKVYLTFHSPADLNLFKLKYEFVEAGQELEGSRLKSSSLKVLNLKDYQGLSVQYDKEESILNLKRAVSPKRIILQKSRLQTARMDIIQKEKQRLSLARQKRHDLQTFKQKSKSLRVISKDCAIILKQYKQHIGDHQSKNKKMMKTLLMTIFSVNFVSKTSKAAKQRQDGLKKATYMGRIMKKCSKRIMNIVKEINTIQPKRQRRQMLTIFHSTTLLSKLMNKKDIYKAKQVVANCLSQTIIAVSLNKLLNHANIYRTKIRKIQRYWFDRNRAQISMFKHFIELQSGNLLQKFMHFGLVRDQFYLRNMPFNLSWQYLKDSSLKLGVIMSAYKARLDEIADMKRMNIEIKQFNEKALKKHQKQYFDIPRAPPKPITKYFRDISILKSMLRSWYQIQYRRMVRKMKKEGKQIPQIQPRNQKSKKKSIK